MSTTPDRRRPECHRAAPERTQQASGHQTTDCDAHRGTESRTDAEWEIDNLEWAAQHLGDAWSAVLRAMARDTHRTPGQYRTAIAAIRDATDRVDSMVRERGGNV